MAQPSRKTRPDLDGERKASWNKPLPATGQSWTQSDQGRDLVRQRALDLMDEPGAGGQQWIWILDEGMRRLLEATDGQGGAICLPSLIWKVSRGHVASLPCPEREEEARHTAHDFQNAITQLPLSTLNDFIRGAETLLLAGENAGELSAHLICAHVSLNLLELPIVAISWQDEQGLWWHGSVERIA